MRTHIFAPPICRRLRSIALRIAMTTAVVALIGPIRFTRGEDPAANHVPPSTIQVLDPFGPVEQETDPFELSDTPIDAKSYVPPRTRWDVEQAAFQGPAMSTPEQELPGPKASAPTESDPCAAARFRPLTEIGIGISQPEGESPTDFATKCWEQINAGPNAAFRCWAAISYNWDPTCLCYQPLYFEEINAERYGYICDDCCCCCGPGNCMQSAASAAHFFGTIPCLPYCLAAECPTDCIYTLGHYRPGSCPPWRWHWPPWDPYAAAVCAGVYTGFVFAIP
jgi:hypothetical protein